MLRMTRVGLLGIGLFALVLTTSDAQDPKTQVDPKSKEEKVDMKFKGQLPTYWGRIGLTEAQRESVYTIQAKYNQKIDTLEKQIQSLKDEMAKERLQVLTAEQVKGLEAIYKEKIGK